MRTAHIELRITRGGVLSTNLDGKRLLAGCRARRTGRGETAVPEVEVDRRAVVCTADENHGKHSTGIDGASAERGAERTALTVRDVDVRGARRVNFDVNTEL